MRRKRTVLVGNAESGKSVLLSFAYVEAAKKFLTASSDQCLPLWLDLGNDLGTDLSIEKALDRKHENLFSRVVAQHPSRLILLFDNLEGALRRNELFYNDLDAFCRRFEGLARIVVACRRPKLESAELYGSGLREFSHMTTWETMTMRRFFLIVIRGAFSSSNARFEELSPSFRFPSTGFIWRASLLEEACRRADAMFWMLESRQRSKGPARMRAVARRRR